MDSQSAACRCNCSGVVASPDGEALDCPNCDGPESPAATKPRVLRSDFDRLRIEYVGGHRPYLWIADADGKFIDAIDVKALREFLKGQRRWA